MNEVWWVTCPSGAANKGRGSGMATKKTKGVGKKIQKSSKKGPGKKKKKRVEKESFKFKAFKDVSPKRKKKSRSKIIRVPMGIIALDRLFTVLLLGEGLGKYSTT